MPKVLLEIDLETIREQARINRETSMIELRLPRPKGATIAISIRVSEPPLPARVKGFVEEDGRTWYTIGEFEELPEKQDPPKEKSRFFSGPSESRGTRVWLEERK